MPNLLTSLLLTAALASQVNAEQDKPRVIFALIVGVNHGNNESLKALAYADDDAALSFDLFRTLGASVTLLTDPDENTRRLHHQAVVEAKPPTRAALEAAVDAISIQVERARRYEIPSTFYFIYAGHGNETEQGQGYLTLANGRLTLEGLRADVIDAVGADETHVIVDACYAEFLVRTRGPGGERRRVRGFSRAGGLIEDPDIGLLLSTSKGQESHEWEAIQAGVFSHEVRSGLLGAADANSDGIVTYREIAAFVERANAAIPNERYRPRVFARPPAGKQALVDLRQGLTRRLEVSGDEAAHYYLEDKKGVRLADFHNASEQAVKLIRPRARGLLYLHRQADDSEFRLEPGSTVIHLSELEPTAPRSQIRGAANHSFKLLFSLPFGVQEVESYDLKASAIEIEERAHEGAQESDWLQTAGWTSVGIAGASLAAAAGLSLSALDLRSRSTPDTSQKRLIELNAKIGDRNKIAIGLYSAAGAAAVTGLIMLLWPGADAVVHADATEGGGWLEVGLRF